MCCPSRATHRSSFVQIMDKSPSEPPWGGATRLAALSQANLHSSSRTFSSHPTTTRMYAHILGLNGLTIRVLRLEEGQNRISVTVTRACNVNARGPCIVTDRLSNGIQLSQMTPPSLTSIPTISAARCSATHDERTGTSPSCVNHELMNHMHVSDSQKNIYSAL
ncbi:hypothetical protein NDU88_003117 [Pleurodeles waltl]|uniref:Uncharacterized protein n=1 Tax=Pleurodeles waltl TaxID=8319 RepID=A0AAV7SFL8_PLEWA|nr:hypothetical protein NDU88_003117 [Pleurodeles waltl]